MLGDGYLAHYGVLGMRWGVRKSIEYASGTHGTFQNQSRDQDLRVKTGSGAYRVQSTKDFTGKGQTYVSLDKLDHVEYVTATAAGEGGVALDGTMSNGNNSRAYSVKLKLTKDLIAPSYSKTMDAFIRTLDDVGVEEVSKSIGDSHRAKEFVKDCGNLTVEDARDRAYVSFAGAFMRDSRAKSLFFGSLKEQGYNAIVDDWDAKFGKGFTKTPLIVFDKDASLASVKADPLTDHDYDYFSDLYFGGGNANLSERFKDSRAKWDKKAGSTKYRDQF